MTRRARLTDKIDPGPVAVPEIPAHPPRPHDRQQPPAEPPAVAPPDPAGSPRPPARSLVAPRRQLGREALKADVPAELELLQRLRRYRLDTGTDIRDQVAIAVDEWLTNQGY